MHPLPPAFQTLGILGKPHHAGAAETVRALLAFLRERGCDVLVDENIGKPLELDREMLVPARELGTRCDLIIVVGGDGSMLHAARTLANFSVPMVGINRGYLGFLTDVPPTHFAEPLGDVLNGRYHEEQRFMLQGRVLRHDDPVAASVALNDIVLYPGEISKMIEFELYVNGRFVYSQRADGLIVSTPTGSTAYSLSAGGPILHPRLNAVAVVPMMPHTLTSRPIVLDADSRIELVIAANNRTRPQLSFDGQVHIPLEPGDAILISKKIEPLRLLHPSDHDYYHVLRTKLNWGSKL